MSKNFVSAMPMAAFDVATLNPLLYLPINLDIAGNPRSTLTAACFLIRLINYSNAPVFVSFDGVNPNDLLLAGATLQLSFQNNASPSNYAALLPNNALIYLNGTAGVGSVFIAGYYQEQ